MGAYYVEYGIAEYSWVTDLLIFTVSFEVSQKWQDRKNKTSCEKPHYTFQPLFQSSQYVNIWIFNESKRTPIIIHIFLPPSHLLQMHMLAFSRTFGVITPFIDPFIEFFISMAFYVLWNLFLKILETDCTLALTFWIHCHATRCQCVPIPMWWRCIAKRPSNTLH